MRSFVLHLPLKIDRTKRPETVKDTKYGLVPPPNGRYSTAFAQGTTACVILMHICYVPSLGPWGDYLSRGRISSWLGSREMGY